MIRQLQRHDRLQTWALAQQEAAGTPWPVNQRSASHCIVPDPCVAKDALVAVLPDVVLLPMVRQRGGVGGGLCRAGERGG